MSITKLKKTGKILLTSLLMGAMSYITPIASMVYAREDTKKPVIITIDNANQEAITGEHILHNLAKDGLDLVINLKPDDLRDNKKVTDLKALFEHNTGSISFSIEKTKNEKPEKKLETKAIELSEQQKSFTQAFNKNFGDYNPIAKTLSIEIPDETIIKTARQAAFKILLSKNKIKEGYALYENGVMEIYRDPEGSIINDSAQIKSVDKLIKDVKENLDSKDPFIITIDTEALLKKYGESDMNCYLRELGRKLKTLQKEENIDFKTFHEFYLKHPQTVQYVMLRLDDYQAFWKRGLFEKVINEIASKNIPQTIAVIPKNLHTSKDALKYLKKISKNKQIELAVHGYHHQNAEFDAPLESQIKTLENSLKEFKYVNGIKLYSVIPPLNKTNEHTSKAMQKTDKNLVMLCSNLKGDESLFGLDKDGIYHMSRTVDVVEKWQEPYQFRSYEEILSRIGSDDAVLMIHPSLHETEESQEYLMDLVKKLKENPKIKLVTLHGFYQTVM